MSKKLTIEHCNKLVSKFGGTCLSDTYTNAHIKMTWKCKNNHMWRTTYNKVQQGKWCRKCYNARQRLSIVDAKSIALFNGGLCLSSEYKGSKDKLLWECAQRHLWEANYESISAGKWCPKCKYEMMSAKFRLNNNIIDDVARLKGGICLNSEKYINSNTKLTWVCLKGHKWVTSMSSVYYGGHWCPECNGSNIQRYLTNILRDIFPANKVCTNFRKFGWLVNDKTNRRLEIDIFVPMRKIAIEYDGEQHFKPVRFGNRTKEEAKLALNKTIYLDKLKTDLIKSHTNEIKYFVRFNYAEKRKINKQYVINKLISNGVVL